MIALGTSSTALSFLKQMGSTVLILGRMKFNLFHLNRLMMSFSSELKSAIVDFDNALDVISLEMKDQFGFQTAKFSHNYFKNLKEILEN